MRTRLPAGLLIEDDSIFRDGMKGAVRWILDALNKHISCSGILDITLATGGYTDHGAFTNWEDLIIDAEFSGAGQNNIELFMCLMVMKKSTGPRFVASIGHDSSLQTKFWSHEQLTRNDCLRTEMGFVFAHLRHGSNIHCIEMCSFFNFLNSVKEKKEKEKEKKVKGKRCNISRSQRLKNKKKEKRLTLPFVG